MHDICVQHDSVYSCRVPQIVTSEVCNSVRTQCNSVAAIGGPSTVVATVKNTGAQNASLTARLGSCTHSNVTVDSQPLNLAPGETSEAVFQVQYLFQHASFKVLYHAHISVCADVQLS